jgi:hypothetical protein
MCSQGHSSLSATQGHCGLCSSPRSGKGTQQFNMPVPPGWSFLKPRSQSCPEGVLKPKGLSSKHGVASPFAASPAFQPIGLSLH